MEILYTFLNIISSFITEVLYDKSLVNGLFSFDINKKYVIFNKAKIQIKEANKNNNKNNIFNIDSNNQVKKIEDLEKDKNIKLYSNEKPPAHNIIDKNIISSTRIKIKNAKSKRKLTLRNSKSELIHIKDQSVSQNEENKKLEKNSSLEVKKYIENINIYNVDDEIIGSSKNNIISVEKDLKNVYINNFLIFCFWCTKKKNNINRILFEEGSKIITERLDVMNMFSHLYIVELLQKKVGIEIKGIDMSDTCKNNLQIFNPDSNNNININNNNDKTIE